MAVDLYKGFTNNITGETFRCISYSEEAFRVDWRVAPNGYVPFEHIHLNQDEEFVVRSGEMKLIIDGEEFIVSEGQRFTVPKGVPHIIHNNKPALLHCIVSYYPGLDTYQFFQCFGGLTLDGDMSKNGTVNISKMLYFGRKLRTRSLTRPTKIPAAFFRLASSVSFWIGILFGWKHYFRKYTQ